jgi:hypothetical protein
MADESFWDKATRCEGKSEELLGQAAKAESGPEGLAIANSLIAEAQAWATLALSYRTQNHAIVNEAALDKLPERVQDALDTGMANIATNVWDVLQRART